MYCLRVTSKAYHGFWVRCGDRWLHKPLAPVLGATRPTSPVAEMSAPLILLLLLRATHIVLPLRCYTDSTNTAGHINTLQRATAVPVLVRRLRQEVRWYRALASFEAVHYPGHIGSPPMNVLM